MSDDERSLFPCWDCLREMEKGEEMAVEHRALAIAARMLTFFGPLTPAEAYGVIVSRVEAYERERLTGVTG